MCGVTVSQDDYVIADTCSTMFVPAARVNEVLDFAKRIGHRQNLMVQAVQAGKPVTEVMHDTQFENVRKDIPLQTAKLPKKRILTQARSED